MSLGNSVSLAVRAVADWCDDRLTIAALGLATGYFGLSDAQWNTVTGLIVTAASALLVLIPDPRKKAKTDVGDPITLVGRADAPVNFVRPPPLSADRDGRTDPGSHNG